jgi:anthranilate phosphoribosyltransferase
MDIKQAISHVVAGEDLTESASEAVMQQIMSGQATEAQIGGFLVALRLKGETVEEVTGFARAMRHHAIPIRPHQKILADTCGTGGDSSGTINISTMAAFVVAGAGLAVSKHGNRSVSSKCGSADVLQALGLRLELTPAQVTECIDRVGIGFLFAPRLHPAMKYAIGPRREMGVRTVFNILGPLTNPAGAQVQVIGVYDRTLTETMAQVLSALGSQAAFVVHGADGLDELSTTGPNWVTRLQDGCIQSFTLDPLDLGVPRAELCDLKGGDAQENATIFRAVLDGKRGPQRDVVLLNSAACLVVGGLAGGFREGLSLAAQSIDSGAARSKLEALVAFSKPGAFEL